MGRERNNLRLEVVIDYQANLDEYFRAAGPVISQEEAHIRDWLSRLSANPRIRRLTIKRLH